MPWLLAFSAFSRSFFCQRRCQRPGALMIIGPFFSFTGNCWLGTVGLGVMLLEEGVFWRFAVARALVVSRHAVKAMSLWGCGTPTFVSSAWGSSDEV